MTVSVQDLWKVYRNVDEPLNHDGSHRLPELASDLDERPMRKWHATAAFVNRKITEAIAGSQETMAAKDEKITRLHNENFDLKKRIAELEATTVQARLVELERCHAITVGKVQSHGEILAKLQGLQD